MNHCNTTNSSPSAERLTFFGTRWAIVAPLSVAFWPIAAFLTTQIEWNLNMTRYLTMAAIALCAGLAIADHPQPLGSANTVSEEQQILDAIDALSRRIDILSIPPAPMPYSGSACGSDGYSQMLESNPCQPAPQVMLIQQVQTPPLRMREPPVLDRGRSRLLAHRQLQPRSAGYGYAAAPCASGCESPGGYSAPAPAAFEGFNWRVSLCDLLRRRSTVREVGPYQIEVRPGLFCTEVTVLP